MELMTIFGEFAQAAAPAAVTALWQAALLAAGLALCLRIAPRLSAGDRFRAWAAGFAAAAMLPFLPWLIAMHLGTWATGGAGVAVEPAAGVLFDRALLHLDPRWTLAIAAVWIVASAWRLADLAVHGLRLRSLWKRAVVIERCADATHIEICSTRDLDRPSVIGFFRPRILIPEWLLERLSERELEQVILHEAEHLSRRDDWTNLAQKLVLAVFPLNPALWWMERRVCREREMACDEAVVRATEKPRDYAACLASLAERGLERRREALSLGAWQRRPELVERVHRILKRGPGLTPAAARGLLAVVGCGLVLGSVELARCPRLVAFVAAPSVVAQGGAAQDSVAAQLAADGQADGQALGGFRAVNAMARVPSRAELAAMRAASNAARMKRFPALATGSQKAGPSARRALARLAQDDSRKMIAQDDNLNPVAQGDSARGNAQSNEMANAGNLSRAPVAVAQQWVVFTAWEQVETIQNAPRVYQNAAQPQNGVPGQAYETSTDAAQPAANAPVKSVAVMRQVIVTRLILRVYPADPHISGANQTGSGDTVHSAVPVPLQQMLPLRAGWLVLQL